MLVLEDGRTFRGRAFGAVGETFGEAVFATGMSGYQETLTDPSYHRQVVVATAPHIGNTGWNDEDDESSRIWVAGYVVRDAGPGPVQLAVPALAWPTSSRAQGVVGMCEVDTRALTRHLRERGAMRVGVSSVETDPAALLDRVRAQPEMTGAYLADEVSTGADLRASAAHGETRFRVVAVDLGIKSMTPHRMAERGIEVHVVPADRDHRPDPRPGAGRRVLLQRARRPRRRPTGPVELVKAMLAAGHPVLRHLLRQPAVRPGARASAPTSWRTGTAASTSR